MANLFEEFLVMPLAASDHRRQPIYGLSFEVLADKVYNLVIAVFHHLFTCRRGIGIGGTCEQQTHEIVDFGDGADRAARVLVRGLLLDGDDGAQAGDVLHLRPFDGADEVPGIGRQGVHVPVFSFGVDGVEGQRRLAAAAESGDDGQGVVRDAYFHIAQVMGARAAYVDAVFLVFRKICGSVGWLFRLHLADQRSYGWVDSIFRILASSSISLTDGRNPASGMRMR